MESRENIMFSNFTTTFRICSTISINSVCRFGHKGTIFAVFSFTLFLLGEIKPLPRKRKQKNKYQITIERLRGDLDLERSSAVVESETSRHIPAPLAHLCTKHGGSFTQVKAERQAWTLWGANVNVVGLSWPEKESEMIFKIFLKVAPALDAWGGQSKFKVES